MAAYHDLGQGILALANAPGNFIVGEQLSAREIYLKDGQGKDTYSYCVFERCEIRYYPDINRAFIIPFQ